MKDSYLHKKIMEEIDEYTVRCENIEALTEHIYRTREHPDMFAGEFYVLIKCVVKSFYLDSVMVTDARGIKLLKLNTTKEKQLDCIRPGSEVLASIYDMDEKDGIIEAELADIVKYSVDSEYSFCDRFGSIKGAKVFMMLYDGIKEKLSINETPMNGLSADKSSINGTSMNNLSVDNNASVEKPLAQKSGSTMAEQPPVKQETATIEADRAMTKSEYIESAQYVQYKKEFEEILEQVGAGALLGLVFGIITYMSSGEFYTVIAAPIMFAGVPYTWRKVPVLSIGCVTFGIKLFVAILAGWIITPIGLIEKYMMMKRFK